MKSAINAAAMSAESTEAARNTTAGPSDASSGRLLVLEVTLNAESKVLRSVDAVSCTQVSVALCHEWMQTNVKQGDIIRVILTHPDGSYQPWEGANKHEHHPVFVTRDANLFIHHPDTLVSGTAIADSFLCLRKSVLTARTPPRNLLGSAGGEAALFGSMIHDLFQRMLAMKFGGTTPGEAGQGAALDIMEIYEAVEDLLVEHMEDLYAAKVSDTNARLVLHNVIPSIMEWFDGFTGDGSGLSAPGVEVSGGKASHRIVIEDVYDIEELIWSPIFGLKGKIDASVVFRSDGVDCGAGVLELKTGSSVGFASVSHSAQVNLYNLLMSDRYNRHITQGLLSYIRYQEALKAVKREQSGMASGDEITLIETKGNFTQQPSNKIVSWVRGEIMGLIMQRNEFAGYARLESRCNELPPLLKGREDLCSKCFANDSCMIQHKLFENGNHETVEGGPGIEVFREKASHLTPDHASYYGFWRRVLSDEEAHAGMSRSEVWTMRGSQREALGRCLSNLCLVDDMTDQDSGYNVLLPPGQRLTATFRRHNNGTYHGAVNESSLSTGDFVLISAETVGLLPDERQRSTFNWQSALTNGFIKSMSPTSVSVAVDRSLLAWTRHQGIDVSNVAWRIDTEEIYASHNTAKRTLENLFCCDEATDLGRLRSLVVDGTRPNFDDQIDNSTSVAGVSHKFKLVLNDDQSRALKMALRAKDYLLILGMPGTGKTTTLAAIVLAYACQGKSVLLCAHTNSAVDNLLQRFVEVGFSDFIRLGRNTRVIDSRIHPYHISTLTERCQISTTEHLGRALDEPKVVATTCLGINHPLLIRRGRFDLVVVDEASQVLQPICLGPLQFAGGPFILVGDHYQLPPLLRAQQATEAPVKESTDKDKMTPFSKYKKGYDNGVSSMNEALFRRLCEFHPEAMVSLSKQYRMASEIMSLSNELVYTGSLSCGLDSVALQHLEIANDCSGALSPWLEAVVEPVRRVLFLDLPDEEGGALPDSNRRRRDGDSRRDNTEEGKVVLNCVRTLVERNVNPQDITVLSPFRAQIGLIKDLLRDKSKPDGISLDEVGVFTIDQYQGRDNECVIVSFVRSDGSVGPLLKDWRRINVALTRAKRKLILVGSSRTLLRGGFFLKGMINFLQSRRWVVPVS